ncbi:CoA binding domain protein [Methyloligella halotolerans]|uniref:CoA binding domain protein n=1 Tax=Methyloligella halotolerans TaxID=1177755 RepID=A0A1E2S2B0_9HYPH|nr:CoA-binding protein [Methyloligella halotolerans]ODA68552.1 CoA binding domain protein [Methyloligella halotolerans]
MTPEMSGGRQETYSDREIREILDSVRTIAVVGASPKPSRPSYFVSKYLMAKGYDVIPVNPGHGGKDIAGARVFESLAQIDRPVDMVDIFRSADAAYGITQQAIAIGAKVVWMQLGVRDEEAAALAEAAGLKVVMNRCPKIEYGRLSGEIGWTGVNSRVLSSRRPGMGATGGQQRTLGPKR